MGTLWFARGAGTNERHFLIYTAPKRWRPPLELAGAGSTTQVPPRFSKFTEPTNAHKLMTVTSVLLCKILATALLF